MNRRSASLIWILLAVLIVGCGAATNLATSAPASAGPRPTSGPPAGQPTSPPLPSGVAGPDIDACQLVSAQEVADLAAGTLFRNLVQQPGSSCIYEIDPGDGSYDNYIVHVLPAEMVAAAFEAFPDQLGEPVAGMGDAAFLNYDEATETYDLQALVRGRFGVEVLGSTKDVTLAVGRLFLSRLLGP